MAGRRWWTKSWLVALVGIAAACGGEDGTVVNTGSIQVALSPGTLTVSPGDTGSVRATLTRSGGFEGTVSLLMSSLPAGVSATMTPSQFWGATASVVIFLSVAPVAPPGSFTVTITATGAGVAQASATYVLTITNVPAIALSVTPASRTIVPGANSSATVGLIRTSFAGPVTLSLLAPPPGITGSFDPSPTGSTGSALTVNVAADVAPGSYPLTVQGSAAGIESKSATLTVTVPAGSNGGNTLYRFCREEDDPSFFAYQDGTGPWQAVIGSASGWSETRYSFNVSQGYGAVLIVHRISGAAARSRLRTPKPREIPERQPARRSLLVSSYETEILYASAVELAQDGAERCNQDPPSKTVNATVAGVQVGQYGILSLGEVTRVFNGLTSTNPVTFDDVPSGILDFVATRTSPGNPPDRAIVLRNLSIPDGGSLPAAIDFNGSGAVTPVSAPITITGGFAEKLEVFVDLVTAHNIIGSGMWFDLSPSSAENRTWAGLGPADLMGSDFHAITVFATPTESTGDYRFATKYAGPVAPQSVTLGAPLAATAVSSLASGAYPRFRFQGALPQDYDKGVEIDIQADDEVANLFVILASAGYLTARGNPLAYDLSMPDIAGLGGFLAGSRLTAGSNTVAVTAFGFTGTGVFDLRPTLGAESKGAVKTSSLAVP